MAQDRTATVGVLYGLAAYLWWGLCPIYFKAVAHVPAMEVLAHRIVWSLVLLVIILARRGDLIATWRQARSPRLLATLTASTLLVAVNWFTFIWAVANDRLLEASLGYFINPLVNVLLGLAILRERLRPLQWASIALATAGVAVMALRLGGLPVISLVLAVSFGLYGLLRKTAPIGGVAGLTVETGLLAPVALTALLLWNGRGVLVVGHLDRATDGLLVLSGVVTALPLIWFANAARRLRYATVGFLQYVAPSGQFLLAVLAYREPFSSAKLLAFVLIWIALGLFSLDTALAGRARAPSGQASV
jgi:chloramphenicol-sensitive protein RarD